MKKAKQSYDIVGQLYETLQQFSYVYKANEFEKYFELVLDIGDLHDLIDHKKEELRQREIELIEIINNQREEVEKGIEEARDEIEVVIGLKSIEEYRQNYTRTFKLFYKLEDLKAKL